MPDWEKLKSYSTLNHSDMRDHILKIVRDMGYIPTQTIGTVFFTFKAHNEIKEIQVFLVDGCIKFTPTGHTIHQPQRYVYKTVTY